MTKNNMKEYLDLKNLELKYNNYVNKFKMLKQ